MIFILGVENTNTINPKSKRISLIVESLQSQNNSSVSCAQRLREIKSLDFHSEECLSKIEEILGPGSKISTPIHCIAVVDFHHKQGAIVEWCYPKKISEFLEGEIPLYAMPDAAHQVDEDYLYFTTIDNGVKLYGVSCFKQKKLTKEMKESNPEYTRNYVQKSICILSKVPTFGWILSKLDPATKVYFNQPNFDNEILRTTYENLTFLMEEQSEELNLYELFIDLSLNRVLKSLRGKILMAWKAMILKKKVIFYSSRSSFCSSAILSLLATISSDLYKGLNSTKINYFLVEFYS